MLRASFFSLLKGPSRQTALWGCNCFPQRLCHNGVLNSIRCCMTSRSCVSLLRVFVCPMLEAERKSFLYPCVIYWYIYWEFTWIYCVYIYMYICIYIYVCTHINHQTYFLYNLALYLSSYLFLSCYASFCHAYSAKVKRSLTHHARHAKERRIVCDNMWQLHPLLLLYMIMVIFGYVQGKYNSVRTLSSNWITYSLMGSCFESPQGATMQIYVPAHCCSLFFLSHSWSL